MWLATHLRQFTQDRTAALRRLPISISSDPDLWYWRLHRGTMIIFLWVWTVGMVAGLTLLGFTLLSGHHVHGFL